MWNDNEFNSTFASPGGTGAKETKKNQIRYVIPVTIETINRCNQVEGENSVFEYNGFRFYHICLIGIIRHVVKKTNDITYIVDDMTASETKLEVKLQSDESDEMDSEEQTTIQQSQFIENQYIKVYGLLKSLQGNKYVQAFRILPIKELNEITYHMLECMNVNIHYQTKNGGNVSNDVYATPSGSNPSKNNSNNTNAVNVGGKNNSVYTGIDLQISNLVKQNSNSIDGISVKEICEYFKTIPENKMREILERLSTDGNLYTTTDDDHYKSTDCL